jgi:mannonate dehydratase
MEETMIIRDNLQLQPGVKLAIQIRPDPTEDDLRFVRQIGIQHVIIWIDCSKADGAYYASQRKWVEDAGLILYGFGNTDVHNQDAIVLNLPNRDDKIEQYKTHLRNLAKAGIPYTTYAHMANGIWSTEPELSRDAPARAFNLAEAQEGHWAGERYKSPLSHGRKYGEDEIWQNYTHFIRSVAPVAEETGVLIGIHPDDPPVPDLGGIPRPIFSSFDGYKRALEIADSPNVGICLCTGCWLEGDDQMGKDVLETIRYFGAQRKIFKVHFRNVSAPLPYFVETFLDNGYMDMYKIMKALVEVDFDGVVIPDHIPVIANDQRTSLAYTVGYMKALLERANAEAAD